jgi:type II secretory pathway component HofQ
VLRALAASSDVTIVSRPLVVTRNGQEARILVGSERPFVQLFRSLPTEALAVAVGVAHDSAVELADAVLDWRDADDAHRAHGAGERP